MDLTLYANGISFYNISAKAYFVILQRQLMTLDHKNRIFDTDNGVVGPPKGLNGVVVVKVRLNVKGVGFDK